MNLKTQLSEKIVLPAKGGRKAIISWAHKKGIVGKSKTQLTEIFIVNHRDQLKRDLVQFLHQEFQKGELKPIHLGLSTTEFKEQDWLDEIAENIVNRLIQYFETIRGQTERNL